MTEQVMLAPCGLDCGPCPIRRAAHDAEFEEDEHQHHAEAVANLRRLRAERA